MLRARLTTASPVRAGNLAAATEQLTRLGVAEPEKHAGDLIALVDGLLFDRLAGAGLDPAAQPDAQGVLRAYLTGLTRPLP